MSVKFELFATNKAGAAISPSAVYSIEAARVEFAKLREDVSIIRIRVRKDAHHVYGGERTSDWLCDWKRK